MSNNLALNLTSTALAQGQRPALRSDDVVLSYAELTTRALGSPACCASGACGRAIASG